MSIVERSVVNIHASFSRKDERNNLRTYCSLVRNVNVSVVQRSVAGVNACDLWVKTLTRGNVGRISLLVPVLLKQGSLDKKLGISR